MQTLYEYIAENPLVYVARDIERALGLPVSTPGYFIVTNESELSRTLAADPTNAGKICVVKNPAHKPYDTYELLQLAEVKNFITQSSAKHILVFKNTETIERLCKENGWLLLNPNAALAKKVEEKISQVEWLGDLKKYLPPHEITVTKEVKFSGEPLVLQFNYGHTGTGTSIIDTEEKLKDIQAKFPDRPVRKSVFINGPVFTCNVSVASDTVLEGNVSYQITGLPPFTDNAFATIGNDWALPYRLLSTEQFARISEISQAVGHQLQSQEWLGLFGVDYILDSQTGLIYLLEINARQPASATFESILQRADSMEGSTIYESHLSALVKHDRPGELIRISDGAQVLQRVTINIKTVNEEKKEKLVQTGLTIIGYENSEPGTDLLRIQSSTALMSGRNTLNEKGQTIATILAA